MSASYWGLYALFINFTVDCESERRNLIVARKSWKFERIEDVRNPEPNLRLCLKSFINAYVIPFIVELTKIHMFNNDE